MLLDLFVFEEIRSEGGTDEDVDLVVRLEAGRHLFVDNLFGDGRRRGGGVIEQELFRGFYS